MAENTNEETSERPAEKQPEYAPASTVPVQETIPDNKDQEKENMEVHHHSHHEGKKSWKSYLWEFLMLFLAVFCGFLAEYQLEHVIEHNREKQFIESFIEDLKIDTASIHRGIIFQDRRKIQLDSLTGLFSEGKIKGYESELYYLGRLLTRTSRFQTNDRTITQLKYSGSLRLIRNEAAADSIIAYQKLVEYILSNQEDERIERRAVDPLLSRIFNPYILDKMLDPANRIIRPENNPPLRSYDTDLQMDLAYLINQLKGSNIILKTRLEQLDLKAKNAIAFLKKEYDLE